MKVDGAGSRVSLGAAQHWIAFAAGSFGVWEDTCVAVVHVYFGIIELCGPVWYNNGVVFAKPVNSRRGVP